MSNQKRSRKDEVRRMTTYLVRREFKGAVTVDHAVKKVIGAHMEQSQN